MRKRIMKITFFTKSHLMINGCSIIIIIIFFFFSLFIKFIIINCFSLASMPCFWSNLIINTHTFNKKKQTESIVFEKSFFILACSISKFSIGLKWCVLGEDDLFISGDWSVLIKGGEAIQLLVIILLSLSLGEVTFDTEPKKQTNKINRFIQKRNSPVSETRTQPSSSIIVSDANRVELFVDVDGLDQNDVKTLYIVWPWIKKIIYFKKKRSKTN